MNPGVILTVGRVAFPLENPLQWAVDFADYLEPFWPKLAVQAKDAVPLSMLNLRSAVQTADEVEAERRMALLTIQRLTRQLCIFVLERQRMELLSAEKELKLDDAEFWHRSYLLEGTVDKNGNSGQTVTVDARLIPPSGKAPVMVTINGDRTNLSQVVDELIQKIAGALNVVTERKQWSATEEAEQYFKESSMGQAMGHVHGSAGRRRIRLGFGKSGRGLRHCQNSSLYRLGAYKIPALFNSSNRHCPDPWIPLGFRFLGSTIRTSMLKSGK